MKKILVISLFVIAALATSALLGVSSVIAATSGGTCAKVECDGENTNSAGDALTGGETCGCGSTVATSENRWCNASKNTVYPTQGTCNGTTQGSGSGTGLKIGFVKPELSGIQKEGKLNSIEDIGTFVTKIGNYLFTFLMAAAVILIIWGAFDFIAGGGDPKRVEGARQKIMWAFVGIAIALLAVFFAPIVQSFLGVSIDPKP